MRKSTHRDQDWESIWGALAPGDDFDTCAPSPVLSALVESPLLPCKESLRAIVPGCGRAYDVYMLSRHGRFASVIGVDVSKTAIAAATAYMESKDPPPSSNRFQLVCGDFMDTHIASGPFDFAFDNALLCALPPTRRDAWAAGYAARLPTGAVLAILMFPIGKPLSEGYPPYGVTLEVYASLLQPFGFECVDGPHILTDFEAPAGRGGGKSAWALWKRVRQSNK